MATKVADVYANFSLVPDKVKNDKVLKDMEKKTKKSISGMSPSAGKAGRAGGAIGGGLGSLMGAGALASLFNPVTLALAGIVATLALIDKGLSHTVESIASTESTVRTLRIFVDSGFKLLKAQKLLKFYEERGLTSDDILDMTKEIKKSQGELTTSPTSRKAIIGRAIGIKATDSLDVAFTKFQSSISQMVSQGRSGEAFKVADEFVGGLTEARFKIFVQASTDALRKEKIKNQLTNQELSNQEKLIAKQRGDALELTFMKIDTYSKNYNESLSALTKASWEAEKSFLAMSNSVLKIVGIVDKINQSKNPYGAENMARRQQDIANATNTDRYALD